MPGSGMKGIQTGASADESYILAISRTAKQAQPSNNASNIGSTLQAGKLTKVVRANGHQDSTSIGKIKIGTTTKPNLGKKVN